MRMAPLLISAPCVAKLWQNYRVRRGFIGSSSTSGSSVSD